MKTYTTPTLVDLGDVSGLTAANQQSTQTDQIFNNGQAIAGSEGIGSRDACISPADNPQSGDFCT